MGFNYYYRNETQPDGEWTPIRLLGFIDNEKQLQLLLNVDEIPRKIATVGSAVIEPSRVYNSKRFVGIVYPEKKGRCIFISPKILYSQVRGPFIKIGCADLSYYFKPFKENSQNAKAIV